MVGPSKRQSLFHVIDLATGWKIDLIIRKSRAFSEEFRRRQRVNLQGYPSFCSECRGRSGLEARMVKAGAIAKAHRGRGRNIENAMGSLDRSYLEQWIAELGLK
ncbi:MAG TPA: hypothetical protein VN948_24005 [Terriglobales bacterium]|nr:hypothetical protein [Terriglobales bacterium]